MCQARQQSRSRTQTYGSERLGFSISNVSIIFSFSIICIIISFIEFGIGAKQDANMWSFNIRCRL